MNCLNCNTAFQGHYCPECGQKSIEGRYTIRGMTADLFFSVAHVEKKGLPHTIKMLTLDPGGSIKDVLSGKRQALYPPFKYLVLIGAIVIVLSLRYNFFHNEITKSGKKERSFMEQVSGLDMEAIMHLENFFKFAEEQATLLNIIAIPVFAFFSWAFLSRGRYNFAENLIINTYVTAQQLFFILLLLPFMEFFPGARQMTISVYTLAIIFYNVWVYFDFYDGKKFNLGTKAILVVLISYIYQFPINFLTFFLYDKFFLHHEWLPKI